MKTFISLLVLVIALVGCQTTKSAWLPENARIGFERYKKQGSFKAFAYSIGGAWGYGSRNQNPTRAIEIAEKGCRSHATDCELYAIGDVIVKGMTPEQIKKVIETGIASMPLAEAKKLTSEFVTSPDTPPRRTTDILKLFSGDEGQEADANATARKAADEKPPTSSGSASLAQFFVTRSQSAAAVGRLGQAIDDLRKAENFAEDTVFATQVQKSKILYGLASLELLAGKVSQGIEDMKKSLAHVSTSPNHGQYRLARYSELAFSHALIGDLNLAEKYLLQAEAERDHRIASGDASLFTDVRHLKAKAAVLEAKGSLKEAEEIWRSLLRKYLARDPRNIAVTNQLRGLGSNLALQGRLVEAESYIRRAISSDAYDRTPAGKLGYRVFAAYFLIRILNDQGRIQEAEDLAKKAIEFYLQAGASRDSLVLGALRSALALSLASQKRWIEAFSEFQTIVVDLSGDPEGLRKIRLGTEFGTFEAAVLLKNGHIAKAEHQLIESLGLLRSTLGHEHQRTATALGLLGVAHANQGKFREALSEFERAVPILVSTARNDANDQSSLSARFVIFRIIIESYLTLITDPQKSHLLNLADDKVSSIIFGLVQSVQFGPLQQAFSANIARATVKNEELADLVRKSQDSQWQIRATYISINLALGDSKTGDNEALLKELRLRVESLEQARLVILGEIRLRFPEYANLLSPKPATIKEIQNTLRPSEALISYYVAENKTYAWAIPYEGEVSFSISPFGTAKIGGIVAIIRSALDSDVKTMGDIPEFDITAAHDLYKILLQPLEGWRTAEHIIVIPHGPISYLPFSVLPDKLVNRPRNESLLFASYRKVPWLARNHSFSTVPSVRSLISLRSLPPTELKQNSFAGFGDPFFSQQQADLSDRGEQLDKAGRVRGGKDLHLRGSRVTFKGSLDDGSISSSNVGMLQRLPDTADEILSIAETLGANPKSDVFIGAEASETRVKTMQLSDRRIIAFATHALVPWDLDGLSQPALALSSPDVTGFESEDGLLTMDEIFGLKLNADWVVLSACNTAAADGAGAEAVSGLGRAFFYAGARAVLATHWPVETTSAKFLTTQLFRIQSNDIRLNRAEALRRTMVKMIDETELTNGKSGERVLSYAHPIFWAPFALFGDGGGNTPGS
jgi:CHAT domain-containing protein/tetratricopeptide (TPR) repeat protein